MENKHYGPIKEVLEFLYEKIEDNANVLEIGPGKIPFIKATHTLGLDIDKNVKIIDIDTTPLPYPDKFFDFVYIRHVLEYIQNPDFVFKELIRVAKKGYIETPSPVVELSNNAESPDYKGYIHHRYIVWTKDNTLNFIPKYPIIDKISMDIKDKTFLKNPIYWNNYFMWDEKTIPICKMWKNDVNFDIRNDYIKKLQESIQESYDNSEKFLNIILHSKQKYIIQVGAHIGNTWNDKLFRNIDPNIIYILIEPVPYLYKQLVENYKNKSNVILLNIAISNKTEPLTLYIPSEKNNFKELPWYASQLASTNKEHLSAHIPNLIVDQICVESKTLNNIIEKYKIKNLEAIYTDTEGHDYEILMDVDLDLLNAPPKTIFFEHKHLDGTHSANLNERPKYFKLLEKFKSMGYYIYNQDSEDCELKFQGCK